MKELHKDFIVYLGDGKELTFPSIGSIIVQSSNVDRDSDYKLDFSILNPQSYLEQLQYFSSIWDKSEIEINRFFLRLSDAILESCERKGKFELPQIGYFELTNDKVYFQSSYEIEETLTEYFTFDNTNKESNHIVSKTILPISHIEETKSDTIYVSRPKYFRQIAAILLVIIVAFSGLYVYNSFFDSYKFPANFNFKDSGYLESDYNKSPAVIDFPTENRNPNKETLDVESQLMEDLVVKDDDELINENGFVDKKDVSLRTNDEYETCTFILGSFGDLQNVKNLEKKILGSGETPIRFKRGNLTRVGVNIPCGSQEKMAKLLEIENEMWLFEE